MKNRIKAFVKQSRFIYSLYFHIGSFLLRILGVFIKTDPNLVLFISYGGQKYDDSPRVVYEYLQAEPAFDSYRCVWAFIDPDRFPQAAHRIRVDTLRYYITAMRAEYGSQIQAPPEDWISVKADKELYVPAWYGGNQKIGRDIEQFDKAFRIGFHETFDGIFIEGKKELEILPRAWAMDRSVFHVTGLPRNDDLLTLTENEVLSIKESLGIPAAKKVILYAPTFREFSRAGNGANALGIPFDFAKWEQALGSEYVMLVTAHYEVAKLLDQLPENDFVINAFKYPQLNDLLKVADILISDYSSIVFDYSILGRPIFCYGYDYDSYAVERGLYTDLDELFSQGVMRTEDALLTAITRIDYDAGVHTPKSTSEAYIAAYGNAAEKPRQSFLDKQAEEANETAHIDRLPGF